MGQQKNRVLNMKTESDPEFCHIWHSPGTRIQHKLTFQAHDTETIDLLIYFVKINFVKS